ncbi:hypothetical protein LNP17_14870 [Klebsiella variicola subsp. variicola]|nr:hypothetical protein [Klebsiella variicola subsp. variicola]
MRNVVSRSTPGRAGRGAGGPGLNQNRHLPIETMVDRIVPALPWKPSDKLSN